MLADIRSDLVDGHAFGGADAADHRRDTAARFGGELLVGDRAHLADDEARVSQAYVSSSTRSIVTCAVALPRNSFTPRR